LRRSNYRHELEANIEPFRGLLLAPLFFMGVGMSIDLSAVRDNLWMLLGGGDRRHRPQGGDRLGALSARAEARSRRLAGRGRAQPPPGMFAFVLLPLGLSLGIVTARQSSLVVALARESPC